MQKSCECTSCGSIIYSSDEKCPYCGSLNNQEKESNKTYIRYQTREERQKNDPFQDINWILFIVLLIVFWPIAIVYLISKSVKK